MNARLVLIAILQSAVVSCAWHHGDFEVLRRTPSDLLRSPDSRTIPFPEVLRSYNGFEPAKSWMELRPFMELRIENAYYQKGSSRRGLQGYLGTEVAHYEVRPKGLQLLSFQPMQNRPAMDLPVQQLIAPPLQTARCYRLYFEIVFNAKSNSHGSVLLAADSEAEMQRLAMQLKEPEKLCTADSAHCTAFPEACSVSVEMEVVVNGKSETILWGSLLSSLLGEHPRQFEIERLYNGRLRRIRIDQRDASALRLPLLPGDRIRWK